MSKIISQSKKHSLLRARTAPNFSKPFRLAVDASDVGAGAVLLQSDDDDDIEHPVCYFSKKFDVHQKNYSTIEMCLAHILAIQHFDIYISLSSEPTVVYIDHNPLVFLHKMKNKNRRLLNWSLMLQEYNLQIEHIKGKGKVCADALSRNCIQSVICILVISKFIRLYMVQFYICI